MSSLLFVNPTGNIWLSTIQKLAGKNLDLSISGISSPDFYDSLNCPNLSIWVKSIDFASTNYAVSRSDHQSSTPFQEFLRQDADFIDDLLFYIYPHIEPLLRHRSGLNWSEHEILETITLYISQSLYFLDLINPSLVVFGTIPHAAWDNVLLLLCERSAINYIFNEPSLVYPFSYMSSGVPGKHVRPVCRSTYISTDLSSYSLSQLDNTMVSLKEQNHSRRFIPNYLRGFVKYEPLSLVKSFCSTLYGAFITSSDSVLSTGSLHKYRDLPYGISVSLFRRFLLYSTLFLSILRSYLYSRIHITRDPLNTILEKPFIAYFPSFQIEYTSLPAQGFNFSHQICIHKITSCLPSDHSLLVKDHPWTFSFISSSLTSRSRSFYKSLSRYPLMFLPSYISPFSILSAPNCRGVVVNGSTVALEAMALGVPVYETCPTYLTPLSCVKPVAHLFKDEQLRHLDLKNPLDEYRSHLLQYCFEFWVGSHEYMHNDDLIEVYSSQMSDFLLSYHTTTCKS
jgi:hypothetical protein